MPRLFGFAGQTPVRLQDYYQQVVNDMAGELNIRQVPAANRVVPANMGWVGVVRHTKRYVAGNGDTQAHYRYRRYREMLVGFAPGEGREALVDLGCGAGWFSWVFPDWAAERGVGYDRLYLYGLDHCPAMLQLAQGARRRLLQYVPDYPVFHCSSEVDALCGFLTENHRENTDYTVTLETGPESPG